MHIQLPNEHGKLFTYKLTGKTPPLRQALQSKGASTRTFFAAAHVTINPFTHVPPGDEPPIDWQATLGFRRYLHELGLGIAEAMDTSQRGMGLHSSDAMELIRQTKTELPDALVCNGVGTDQLDLDQINNLEQVIVAYLEQLTQVQAIDGRVILMASRALARLAKSSDDYLQVYGKVLAECNQPIILHWLGDMFDPALAGYWGGSDIEQSMQIVVDLIKDHARKIDGIKISLLDKNREIQMRRLLPEGVRMYTGDDFHYSELIAGDDQGFSHALLGIFDPLAPLAAFALTRLEQNDIQGFHDVLDPTVPLARAIFQPPTQYYKTGVVFLAWLNNFQQHFIMLGGAQSMRSLAYFVDIFMRADSCGLFRDPELAAYRMQQLLRVYGV